MTKEKIFNKSVTHVTAFHFLVYFVEAVSSLSDNAKGSLCAHKQKTAVMLISHLVVK
jgi:hypothetical protein